ncbi:MFS transporter [Inhella proteolytica]|uniref:MFS transporter n=1 Tax=Inhella proteolytica TaxID=2795029 RepID=UPI002873B7A6|nr:MFS transporter [Inhella proteolytica]
MAEARDTSLVLRLGTAQTLAWASSYYLPAMLAQPMARELGLATGWVYGAFSLALVVSALVGPRAGHWIDRHGGRPVLATSSLLFALALAVLALAPNAALLLLGWALLGLAMGSGLYEAAFAALVYLKGPQARSAITGITLIAGFASTVGWPLSAALEQTLGWRAAVGGWAALHLLLGLPLNLSLPRGHAAGVADVAAQAAAPPRPLEPTAAPEPAAEGGRLMLALLAFVFAATWFISTAIAVHLPVLLMASGAPLAAAVAAGALVGPAQVGGRVLEFLGLRRQHPLRTARWAAAAHPLGALALLLLGPAAAPAFALLHGAGNGILTIAKGTLPLALFGPAGYGRRQGWLMLPARLAQAAAPLAFGLALQAWGVHSLWLCIGLAGAALAALAWIRPPPGG